MSISNVISNYIKPIREWYSEINSATLTGAIDVIVVEQPDGSFLSSPFHVRFGKLGVLKAKEKVVDIEVNDEPVDIRMKLDDTGAAFFVEGCTEDDGDYEPELATSPLPEVNAPPSWKEADKDDGTIHTEKGKETSSTKSSSRDDSCSSTRQSSSPMRPGERNDESPSLDAASTTSQKGIKPVRKKRRRRVKHSRWGSKSSLQDFVESEAKVGSSDGIFDMDDVIISKEASSELDELASTPFSTLDMELPFGKSAFVSISVPTSPVSVHVLGPAADDQIATNGSLPPIQGVGLSSSCSKLNEDQSLVAQCAAANSDNFLMSRLPQPEKLDKILANQSASERDGDVVNEPNAASSQMQYFSEPEMSPVTSPMGSRPGTPVMSDTEVEARRKDEDQDPAERSWEWGKLPTANSQEKRKPSREVKPGSEEIAKEKESSSTKGWGFSYLWRGSKKVEAINESKSESPPKSKAQENQTLPEPVYLQDLENDEEMLKIYVGCHLPVNAESKPSRPVSIAEDDESGNGPSLPTSPNSVEGAIGGPVLKYDNDFDSAIWKNVDISLCGGLDSSQVFSTLLFEQSKLSFEDFKERLKSKGTSLFDNPNLVVRLGEQYYVWSAVCPIIMSRVLFGQPLPSDLVEVVTGSYQDPDISAQSVAAREQPEKKSSLWWPFGPKKDSETEKGVKDRTETKVKASPLKNEESGDKHADELDEANGKVPPEEVKRKTRAAVTLSSSSDCSTADELIASFPSRSGRYRKTMRLSNEAITALKLKPGCNEVQFSVTTAFQGTTRCNCHLYLWKWTDKLVISDIDGTITKSDVLGHVLPIIGKDWAQSGVASLFTNIKNNGYHLAYLSARAIGQASVTKDYLSSITQGDVSLPDGPLLLNPTSLVNAFHREIIIKKPEEFKIACLRDIQKLFPDCLSEDGNPFYAGYGNRVNDVWAYRAVGIPYSRIFTVNSRGELRHDLTKTFQTSYCNLEAICDHVFPPREHSKKAYVASAYSSFSYWKDPLPQLNIEDALQEFKA